MDIRGLYSTHRERLLFLIRYGISGATGGAIQVVGLFIWVSLLGLEAHYLWGVGIAYCIAVVVTFALQKYWTFRNYDHETVVKQMIWYTAVSLGNLGVNTLILHSGKLFLEARGVDFFDGWYLVVQVVAVGTAAILSFLSNRYITFRAIVP